MINICDPENKKGEKMRQVHWMTLFRKEVLKEEIENLPFEIVWPRGGIKAVVLSPDDEKLRVEPKSKPKPAVKAPSAMYGPYSG